MLFCNIGLIDENLDYHPNMFVGTSGSTITYIGSTHPSKYQNPHGEPQGSGSQSAKNSQSHHNTDQYGQEYDGRGKLLMPGLYNMHAHSTMTLLRGYAENLPLQRWLTEMVFPFEAKIDEDAALSATRLAVAEMLRYGTVSFSDMYFFDDARAQAVGESGIKCNLGSCISVFDPDIHYQDTPFALNNHHIYSDLAGEFDGRLQMDMCLHSEYTTTPTVVREASEQAQEFGVGMHIHVSETEREVQECKERHGMTPPQYLDSLGVFDLRTTAAHCVWLEDCDYNILADKGVTIATNPASNLKLGSGFLLRKKVCDNNIRLAIGTDGAASNNSQNMFREMYMLATIHRGFERNTVGLSPKDVLYAATAAGAYAQGRDSCGCVKVGNKADLVVLDINNPWMQPVTDMLTNVIYSQSGEDVVLTMVDGNVVYRDGEWTGIDVEKAIAETQMYRDRIVAAL